VLALALLALLLLRPTAAPALLSGGGRAGGRAGLLGEPLARRHRCFLWPCATAAAGARSTCAPLLHRARRSADLAAHPRAAPALLLARFARASRLRPCAPLCTAASLGSTRFFEI